MTQTPIFVLVLALIGSSVFGNQKWYTTKFSQFLEGFVHFPLVIKPVIIFSRNVLHTYKQEELIQQQPQNTNHEVHPQPAQNTT
jgi:hypothetical protein